MLICGIGMKVAIYFYTYTYKQSFQMLSGSCGRLHEMFATFTYFGES